MTFEELKDKALSLPLEPGVYLMQDKSGQIIYVGKAKKLKNRVSQYFQNTAAHTPKTRKMVSQIDHFDVIKTGGIFPFEKYASGFLWTIMNRRTGRGTER